MFDSLRFRPAGFAACLLGGFMSLAPLSAPMAQEGVGMRRILSGLGILPEEKDPIEYRERAPLVVPKETSKLRAPEEGTRTTAQWPTDPDIVEREQARRRRGEAVRVPLKSDAAEGGRLSITEMERGRVARGTQLGEGPIKNDSDVRMTPEEMAAADKKVMTPTYPPGTEPPRRYLTDPPVGVRRPAAGAPTARARTSADYKDDLRVNDAWGRLD